MLNAVRALGAGYEILSPLFHVSILCSLEQRIVDPRDWSLLWKVDADSSYFLLGCIPCSCLSEVVEVQEYSTEKKVRQFN